jgi:hypothetical protein
MTDFNDQYTMTIAGKSVGADGQLEAFNPATTASSRRSTPQPRK